LDSLLHSLRQLLGLRQLSDKARRPSRVPPRRRSAKVRHGSPELLEPRLLLSFDPSGTEQEVLFNLNRMRCNPQGELSVLFSSVSPLVARDSGTNAAIQYFNDPTSAEIQADWPQLQPTAPLAWSPLLYGTAAAHSQLMIQDDQQSHQLPGEPVFTARFTNAGYAWFSAGENCDAYGTGGFNIHSAFAADYGNASTNYGHRTNMMNSGFREVGIAVVPDTRAGVQLGPLVVTEDFGNRSNIGNPYLLGAVYNDSNHNGRYDAGEGLAGVTIRVTGAAGTFTTTTMSAGGYQLQVPNGSYLVSASGGALSGASNVPVVVNGNNVEADFTAGLGTGYVNFNLVSGSLASVVGLTSTGDWWMAKSSGSGFVNQYLGGWNPAAGWQNIQVADFNGDGKADISGMTSSGGWYVAISNGTSLTTQAWGGWNPLAGWQDVHVGDFNGDGKADLVGRTSSGGWYVALSNSTGFTNQYWGSWNPSANWQNVSVADVNGDGKSDLVGMTSSGDWYAGLSSSTSFANQYWGAWNPGAGWTNVQIADVNGDGKADVVGMTSSGGWYVALSNGAGFINQSWGAWNPSAGWTNVQVADANGDGKADVVGMTSSGNWYIALSNGASFTNQYWGGWNPSAGWTNVHVADVNGDGKADVVGMTSSGGWFVALSNGASFTNQSWGGWNPSAGWQPVLVGKFG
jgi:hypothetical protein